jgi:hypothetical protein
MPSPVTVLRVLMIQSSLDRRGILRRMTAARIRVIPAAIKDRLQARILAQIVPMIPPLIQLIISAAVVYIKSSRF